MSDIGYMPPGMMPPGMMPPGMMPPDPSMMMGGMDPSMMGPPPPPPFEPPQEDPDADPMLGFDPELLLTKFKRWWDDDVRHWDSWRKRATEDFSFAALDQWTQAEKDLLEEELRVPIVFDRIGPIVESVLGQQVANRQEARYIPREPGDVKVNELLTGAAEWFRDQSNADSEETAAFKDVLICGLGCVETTLDYEADPEGAPRVEQIDIMEMLADCNARKTNLRDARRLWRLKTVPLEEAQSMFPDFEATELDAAWAILDLPTASKGDASTGADGSGRRSYSGVERTEDEIDTDGYVTLVEVQWYERETFYRIIDPLTGEEAELDEDAYDTFMSRAPSLTPLLVKLGMSPVRKGVRQTRKVFYKAFIGSVILEIKHTIDPDRFNYQFITGYKDRNKGVWIGLVTKMKDPQRWANKWLSQTLHILNSQAGAGMMMEEEQRLDPSNWETEWTRPNSLVRFRSGALTGGKIQAKPQAQFPQGYSLLMEFAGNAVREASGVNLEQLGMREAVQPGVLEYQRRQSGVQVLSGLFDALRLYRYDNARLILVILQDHLSDGRLIRIAGEGNEQLVPLTRDKTIGAYDIIVDEAPTSPNQKEATWQVIMALMPYFGEMVTSNPQVAGLVLGASPLPSSLVESLKEAMTPPEPTPEEQESQQLQLESQRQLVRGMGAEAGKDEAQKTNYEAMAHLNEMKAQEEMQGGTYLVDQAQAEHYRALAQMHEARARETMQKMIRERAMPLPVPPVRPLGGLPTGIGRSPRPPAPPVRPFMGQQMPPNPFAGPLPGPF
jgi:hypothetical protein